MQLIVHTFQSSSTHPGSVLGEVRSHDGTVYAHLVDGAVGGEPGDLLNSCEGARRVIVRCGDPINAEKDQSEAARMLASWSQAGWTAFDEDVAQLDRAMGQAGVELMIRPSSEGMLSDAICTMAWARRAHGVGCKLFLDPMGWMVESMMGDVGDHLQRIGDLCVELCRTDGLAGGQRVGAVLIRSVRMDDSGTLMESGIGEGMIDPKLIIDRLGGLIGSGVDIAVVESGDLDLLGL